MGDKKQVRRFQVWPRESPFAVRPHEELLYLDAGAWQGNEKGDYKTNFILISGHGAVLCNYKAISKSSHTNLRAKSPHQLIQREVEIEVFLNDKGLKCRPILDFLKLMDPSGRNSWFNHIQCFYVSKYPWTIDRTIPFWYSNSLLIVIGDLHLHLFRQRDGEKESLVDNFIKKESGKRLSLEKDFRDFLNKICEYKKSNPNVDVKVVQAGDIVDIWEVEYMLDKNRVKIPQVNYNEFVKRIERYYPWISFPGARYDKFAGTVKVDPTGFLVHMKKRVFTKLFESIDKLKELGIPFIILQGNHDDTLLSEAKSIKAQLNLEIAKEFNEGPDYMVHIEHGHRFDSANEPGGDSFGRFLTKRTVDFEKQGWGDFFKDLEEPAREIKRWVIFVITFGIYLPLDQRDTYLKASKDVTSWFEKNKKEKLSIFIMAHTHIPYGRKVPYTSALR
jgi:UDP-2,3-diacylglucosamine pyrophosphatase LpxH